MQFFRNDPRQPRRVDDVALARLIGTAPSYRRRKTDDPFYDARLESRASDPTHDEDDVPVIKIPYAMIIPGNHAFMQDDSRVDFKEIDPKWLSLRFDPSNRGRIDASPSCLPDLILQKDDLVLFECNKDHATYRPRRISREELEANYMPLDPKRTVDTANGRGR